MIHIVYGTRAELIKFSSLIRELKKRKIDFRLIDTQQHDTEKLRESLELPKPDYSLGKSLRDKWSKLESNFFTYPIAVFLSLIWGLKVFLRLFLIFLKEGKAVVCHGNTMSVPLTVYAKKIVPKKIKLVHYESGLRGNTKSSMFLDAFYRIADKNADILFAPSKTAVKNLKKENVKGKIIFIGDTINGTVSFSLKIKPKITIPKNDYVFTNLTRSIKTKDDAEEFVNTLLKTNLNMILSINPVIKYRLERFGFMKKIKSIKNLNIVGQLLYPDVLHLIKNSLAVVTDSTGVEEECAVLRKPCIATNDFIQFPELENAGIVSVTGWDSIKILNILNQIKKREGLYITATQTKFSLGGKKAMERIVNYLEKLI